MTNFEKLMKSCNQFYGGIESLAQLLVVKKDDYNYTSNLLFENFSTRQQAVDATINKLKDTYKDFNYIGFFKKIFYERINVMAGGNFDNAKTGKNDEFYTQFTDVSKELMHYKNHFKDKTVLCNCDDPTWSAFWKYFHLNFKALGLKKLISTHYDKSNPTYKMEYESGDDNDIEVGVKTPLEGNGDFRNQECLDLLDEADIIVTNPPFSLFREYVAVLMEHNKKFIIWGNNNAITYKEFFPLLKDNEVWLGYIANQTCIFRLSDDYKKWDEKITAQMNDGHKYGKCPAISVFTNLDIKKRHEKVPLWKTYSADEYSTFDELPDIINVDKVTDIPVDYDGLMAVPITFLNKYNPEQFEIIDGLNRYTILDYWGINEDVRSRHSHCCNINGKSTYYRIVIRRKDGK